MSDFLLELLSEEIPARMQAKASADLARLFAEKLGEAGLYSQGIETWATPRRLALIARGLPAETEATVEEIKGPRASAPPQALDGFLRKTGLVREQLVERDGIFFATLDKPGRATASVLAEAIPQIVRAFPWPKSMRWGAASVSTDSIRWVRPLQGIVALLGEDIVDFEVAGVASGAATVGHRFHHPGIITIGSANDYAEKLRACRVILDPAERKALIRERAHALATAAGLTLVEDEALLDENAGLTEWPVPLLGSFDPAFLEVPPEVIQLTMRTNQKYFALNPPRDGEGDRAQRGGGGSEPGTAPPPPAFGRSPSPSRGGLAPNFICVANIEASDGGHAIVAGNERVLSARLSDAKFFWEQDLKIPLEEQAKKLDQIVFHEKLGTVADKVERVAKLARWLVEEGVVGGTSPSTATIPRHPRESGNPASSSPPQQSSGTPAFAGVTTEELAQQAETAARLCKADLVTGLVGEFPELQGIIGGHLARAQGQSEAIADAIRDHYKPVGQGDDVPGAPVTVAVSLADKLDTLVGFFFIDDRPSGSRDPFALRRAAISVISIVTTAGLRLKLLPAVMQAGAPHIASQMSKIDRTLRDRALDEQKFDDPNLDRIRELNSWRNQLGDKESFADFALGAYQSFVSPLLAFFADRLKVQQREAGVRHDLIDAVFALGGEDDLVRLLARVKALQAFVETPEGADLLAGYKRAANILKKEAWTGGPDAPARHPELEPDQKTLSYTPLDEEAALIAALDSAEPKAGAAVAAEDFEGAMAALATLRAPVDAFFDKVTVNDPDQAKRRARLNLLLRMRDAVHRVADFSKIEG